MNNYNLTSRHLKRKKENKFDYYKNPSTNKWIFSEIILESSVEKLVENSWWRLAVLTKNRWSPLCDAITDEKVFWAPCTRIVWCCFQINAKRRPKIVIARVFLEFHGEYWEFSLLALQLNVEDINLVYSLFCPRQQDITPVFRLGDTALN